jgi:hypothetical protein
VSGARIVYDVRVLPSGTFFGVSTDGDALVEGRVPPLGA